MRRLRQIVHQRLRRRLPASGRSHGSILKNVLIVFGFSALAVFAALLFAYVRLTQRLPSLTEFEARINARPEPTFFTDRSGRERVFTLRYPAFEAASAPRYPAFESYSKELLRAIVAAEQPDFMQDGGGLFALRNFFDPEPQRISEKLALIVFKERLGTGLGRTIRLRIVGSQIQKLYPREKLLIAYIENAWFAQFSIGVRAALRTYLDKGIDEATFADGVLLSAILDKPALNPIDSQGAMRTVYLAKIDSLLSDERITAQEAESLRAHSFLIFEPPEPERSIPPNPILQKAIQSAMDEFGVETVERGDLAIQTTIDAELQAYLNCLTGVVPDEPARRGETEAPETGADETDQPDGTSAEEDQEPDESAPVTRCPIFGESDDDPTRAGREAEYREILRSAEVSAYVLDVKTGNALAGIQAASTPDGSRISEKAFRTYSPGSVLTPFAALTAYKNGFSPADGVWDIPSAKPELVPVAYLQSGQTESGPIRLRSAITEDRLAPIVELTREIGSDKILKTLSEFGLSNWSGLNAERLYFNGGYVSVEGLAFAYSAFAGGGQLSGTVSGGRGDFLRPRTILHAFTRDDPDAIVLQPRESLRLVDESLAYLINHTLSAENQTYRYIDRPAAVKLGKTIEGNARWLVGYTPDRVIALRIGGRSFPAAKIEAAAIALFRALAERTLRGVPPGDWVRPENVRTRLVCAESGKLPTEACPNLVTETFLSGSEPTEADNLYQSVWINEENQSRSTALTPLHQRFRKTYLNLPDFAKRWAEREQIETVPNTYDTVRLDANETADTVEIVAPVPFTDVRLNPGATGQSLEITVELNADPPAQTLRVQYGIGLDPTQWYLLNEISDVRTGRYSAASFDYASLPPGIYVIRVAAIDEAGRYAYDDAPVIVP